MRLIEQKKYDYDDVLLMPKRSTLASRKDVNLVRRMEFKYGKSVFEGIPIMAANMDSVATIPLALAFEQHGMFTCLHKFIKYEDIRAAKLDKNFFAVTIGKDKQALDTLADAYHDMFDYLCIDVANGYAEEFAEFVSTARSVFPNKVIIAGNVCTPEMTLELIMRGADIVKVGIGPGCFVPGTLVRTRDGLRPIEQVEIGDYVITHTGSWQRVTNTFRYDDKKSVVSVNGVKSTDHHEYYVVDRADADLITDDNIHEYAQWVSACDLDKSKHLLVKRTDDFELVEIEELSASDYTGYVYDLEVENDHSYNVDGIIVHNSACLTRQQTGVGVPQFSAVMECADAAHGVGGRIIGDGGIKTPGDFAKCFGAGADFAMAGTMFAGHTENSKPDKNNKVSVYGMSSNKAMETHYVEQKDYRTSEGRVIEMDFKGGIKNTITDILGGVRSACTYIGAKDIRDMSKCATFNLVNNQLSKKYEAQTVGK